jgi:Tfp pilus assembly protein FimT
MNLRSQLVCKLAVLAVVATLAMPSRAQVINSGASTITLQAVLSQSITLTLSGNAVNFNLTAGSAANPGSTSITATTTWTLRPNLGNLNVYAFFSNSAAALTDGAGNNIPSADFQISNNGGAFTALTNTVPFGGANAGLQLSSTKILGNNRTGTRNDVMNFNINLAPLPNLPAGAYTGTLTIQAQAI